MNEITTKEEVIHPEIEEEMEGSIAIIILDSNVKYVKILIMQQIGLMLGLTQTTYKDIKIIKEPKSAANQANMQQESRNQTEVTRNNHGDIAKPEDIADEICYPDPGAAKHMTNNLSNLNLGSKEYRGKQCIHMGNDVSTKTLHTGNAYVQGDRQLYLNNLLTVPQIKKILISVS